MSDDWFRRHTWTETDKAEFFARLRRSRGAFYKAQYARIQAYELFTAGGPRYATQALQLLDMIVASWMDEAQCAAVHHQRAECLRELGRDAEAVAAYRDAFAEQRRVPGHITQAHVGFAWWVAVSARSALFDEALGALDEFSRGESITFPANEYRSEGARALIHHARGDRHSASFHARRALNAAGEIRGAPRDQTAHALLMSIASS